MDNEVSSSWDDCRMSSSALKLSGVPEGTGRGVRWLSSRSLRSVGGQSGMLTTAMQGSSKSMVGASASSSSFSLVGNAVKTDTSAGPEFLSSCGVMSANSIPSVNATYPGSCEMASVGIINMTDKCGQEFPSNNAVENVMCSIYTVTTSKVGRLIGSPSVEVVPESSFSNSQYSGLDGKRLSRRYHSVMELSSPSSCLAEMSVVTGIPVYFRTVDL